jgi:hypothetical protein
MVVVTEWTNLVAVGLFVSLLAGCSSGSDARLPPEFVATVEEVDENAQRVTWLGTCGEHEGDEIVTSVSGSTFEYESEPADPAAGRVVEIDFADWADSASSGTWVVVTDGEKVASVRSFATPSDHDPCSGARASVPDRHDDSSADESGLAFWAGSRTASR